jgi:CPA2 family monovalent cation:H+ antiporter-2
MFTPLAQCLILLAGSVFLVTLARRLALPTSAAYLVVGLLLGPHALAVLADSGATRLLADLGVAFLLFTLGLKFSLPRMLAMRREVFVLGGAQVVLTATVFAIIGYLLGVPWLVAIVLGGAVAISSTAILLQQLTESSELNRTHGRLAFSMLLFQDLAFVPFLALASVLMAGTAHLTLAASVVAVRPCRSALARGSTGLGGESSRCRESADVNDSASKVCPGRSGDAMVCIAV